jgi:hypothetical protein
VRWQQTPLSDRAPYAHQASAETNLAIAFS